MSIQINKPRTLYQSETCHVVEYEPQKRTIVCRGTNITKKFYIAFPYVQFYHMNDNLNRQALHISLSKEPCKEDFSNTFSVPLPNIYENGRVCLGEPVPSSLENAIHAFWNARFNFLIEDGLHLSSQSISYWSLLNHWQNESKTNPDFAFNGLLTWGTNICAFRHGKVNDNGNEYWFFEDNLHREDGPAIIYVNGNKEWFFKGQRHRLDGPAIERVDGYKAWYLNGELHREGAPATIGYGNEEWCINGKRHRLDGPALTFSDGEMWYKDGKRHRVGAPAVIGADGSEEWYFEGAPHREEGPAITNSNQQSWFLNGFLHRIDGPAIIYANGSKVWCLWGNRYPLKTIFVVARWWRSFFKKK